MEKTAPSYKRRQYLVDRVYQLRFVQQLLTVIALMMVASFLAACSILWSHYGTDSLGPDSCLPDALIGIALSHAVSLMILTPILYFFGIRQTHRVVGPLNRMKQTLTAIGNGDFSQRIILRKGDVLIDFAENINRMAEALQARFPTNKS
jgi:methyl-accepting chemotaxis protein